MAKLLSVLTILFVFSASPPELYAQSWEVGTLLGGSGYIGDLNPSHILKINNAGGGIFVRRNFDGYWSARLNLALSRLSASDSDASDEQQRRRNLSFFSPLSEISLQTEFNFFDFSGGIYSRYLTPYVFTGLGISFFDPRATLNGETRKLRAYKTEGQENTYSNKALNIPLGAGLKYALTEKLTVASELGYRIVFSDYLDDVSSRYADFSSLPTDDVRRQLADRSVIKNPAGVQRGDGKPRDTYFFLFLTLSYTFKGCNCPTIR